MNPNICTQCNQLITTGGSTVKKMMEAPVFTHDPYLAYDMLLVQLKHIGGCSSCLSAVQSHKDAVKPY